MLSKIKSLFTRQEPKISEHKLRIFRALRKNWCTQMDCAQMGITLNLSKRLCEMEYEIAPEWKIERRWRNDRRVKEYRIFKA